MLWEYGTNWLGSIPFQIWNSNWITQHSQEWVLYFQSETLSYRYPIHGYTSSNVDDRQNWSTGEAVGCKVLKKATHKEIFSRSHVRGLESSLLRKINHQYEIAEFEQLDFFSFFIFKKKFFTFLLFSDSLERKERIISSCLMLQSYTPYVAHWELI